MKNGLLIYEAKNHRDKNIGDYIQSIAAEQFTGKEVVFVEREHLHVYDGEPIKLIMNGWFMHYPKNWPPSENIKPLFTSFHINPNKAKDMLSAGGIEYLKNHEPIGCRDGGTERLLLSKGIKAYFSGCLTLTLGLQYKNSMKKGKVCFVDPYYKKKRLRSPINFLSYFFILILSLKSIFKISKKLHNSTSLKALLLTAQFYKPYSKSFSKEVLRDSEYITHIVLESSFENEKEKFDYARNLLKKYSESEFVVTSRIHAALPCLAMDTPVIFITNDYFNSTSNPISQGRFEGLIELLNVLEYSKDRLKPFGGFSLNKKIGFGDRIKNKKKHHNIVEGLKRSCTSFISSSAPM